MTFFTIEFQVLSRKAAKAHSKPEHGIEIYYYESGNGKPCAIAFAGKAQKPAYLFAYRDEQERETHAAQWIEGESKRRQERSQAKAEKLQFQHTLKEGDLLRAQWGYEQTNNDFYQVVAVKGKSVIVREIAQKKEYSQSMAGTTQSLKNHFIGEPELKHLTPRSM